MKLLLDTHIFLWFINGDVRLPILFRDKIQEPNNEVYLPNLHRDPFDRILISQALNNNLTVVTVDWEIMNYSVSF